MRARAAEFAIRRIPHFFYHLDLEVAVVEKVAGWAVVSSLLHSKQGAGRAG